VVDSGFVEGGLIIALRAKRVPNILMPHPLWENHAHFDRFERNFQPYSPIDLFSNEF
jgi:hypothetical protein